MKWQIGWCKASGKEIPVMNDPQYDLLTDPSAPRCEDFAKGKPRKKRPTKKEERLMKILRESK